MRGLGRVEKPDKDNNIESTIILFKYLFFSKGKVRIVIEEIQINKIKFWDQRVAHHKVSYIIITKKM